MNQFNFTSANAQIAGQKGVANGLASLDSNGLVPNSQLPGATQSAAGTMSAADKTKLDGIATGATANVVSDSLSDTSTTNALSAAKGKALNDSVTALNTQIANLITTEAFTITISESVAAGTTKSYSKDVTKNGYTPLGVIQQFGSGTGSFAFQDYYIEGNSLVVYVRNVSGSAATLNYIKVVVLYKAN